MISELLQALRGVCRNPGFALLSIVTLALGIGISTAVFSVASGVLLTGKELWSAKLDATANANPTTCEGKDRKQYVAIIAGLTLNVFALP